ncbi:MAG: MoaD/ThiS family protein [Thermodesulfobacteriota bacterium]
MEVRIKLFAGLEVDAGMRGYDPLHGIVLDVPAGARLKVVTKRLGLPDGGRLMYFINGVRVGLWHRLKDGDEIACLRPLAGG